MNFKNTLILIALLVVVGGYVIYDRLTSSPVSSADAKPKTEKLITLTEPEITGVTLESPATAAGGKVSFAKPDPTRWEVTAPFKGPADFGAVSMLVSSLIGAESKGDADPSAVAAFRADATVTLSTATGQRTIIGISAPNGVGESIARVETGGKIRNVIVPGDLVSNLKKSPSSFRDLRLVTVDSSAIQSVTLATPKETIALVKDGEGWKMLSPIQARADDAAVNELLSTISFARASEFLDNAPAGAFDAPQLVVTYFTVAPSSDATTAPTSRPTTEHVIRFGRFEDLRQQKVLVASESGTATVPVATLTSLKKTPQELRDKRVVDLRPADIAKVQILNLTEAATRPNLAVTLSRKNPPSLPSTEPSTQPSSQPSAPHAPDSTWMLDGKPADAEKVDTFLETFHPLRTTKFLAGPLATQPATPWMVTLTTFSGASYSFFVGDTTCKFTSDIFEPPADLLAQLKASFVKPPPPIPFLGAGDTTHPAKP
jgi:hypothetical protein